MSKKSLNSRYLQWRRVLMRCGRRRGSHTWFVPPHTVWNMKYNALYCAHSIKLKALHRPSISQQSSTTIVPLTIQFSSAPSICLSLHSANAHISNATQTSQADIHNKIMRAIEERDILHEAKVRATQEQYAREMANLREELLEARKRWIVFSPSPLTCA